MYASASRFTFRPARANETRPAGGNGRRKGSSSGRVSRTIRPRRWMFSIDPVIGLTSSPSSVTSCPMTESGGGNMCAPTLRARSPRCFDQMRPPTRSDASSTTGSCSRRRCAATRPAIPPPTMTTSRSSIMASLACCSGQGASRLRPAILAGYASTITIRVRQTRSAREQAPEVGKGVARDSAGAPSPARGSA